MNQVISKAKPEDADDIEAQSQKIKWLDLNADGKIDYRDANLAAVSFYTSFKSFALQKSVFDMASGIMVGGALATVAKSLVTDIITPLVVVNYAGANMEHLFVELKHGVTAGIYSTPAEAQLDGAVTLNYGNFLTVCLDFLFVSLAVWAMFKFLNWVGNNAREQGMAAMKDLTSKNDALNTPLTTANPSMVVMKHLTSKHDAHDRHPL
jgi:large conductance mechanosensitive channel